MRERERERAERERGERERGGGGGGEGERGEREGELERSKTQGKVQCVLAVPTLIFLCFIFISPSAETSKPKNSSAGAEGEIKKKIRERPGRFEDRTLA